jgi:dTDP-D-glucose 4,6-dehydratase
LELGWRPRWDFERAVKETVTWYKETAGGRAAREVTTRQIEHYCQNQL